MARWRNIQFGNKIRRVLSERDLREVGHQKEGIEEVSVGVACLEQILKMVASRRG